MQYQDLDEQIIVRAIERGELADPDEGHECPGCGATVYNPDYLYCSHICEQSHTTIQ